ncbi:zinc finger protein 37 isoform X8 [Agrilus planipennis]|uniref:Zinc finger protein 37 isoform X8 n=1 Tax=Agrilus planipennis TaxID=224129 RepID=A0A7F5R9A4_AGRPL|nr:zinc finger protein 37 isoform X8 [Agrilus planipennis]
MVNSVELMQLCRLCLVKDEVNIPIFDNETDVQQIFLKISTCLPVKVTQDDNLPKKICNDCSYKLDLCYQFWNTSANSEKQLVTWLNEVGLSQETLNEAKLQKTESNSTPGLVLKQETIEPESESSHEVVNNVSTESQEYILQQQQLPYQTPAFPFTDDNFVSGESANAGASKTHTNNKRESTLKRKRQAVATVTQPDSDDDVDEDIDDPTETKVAKTEETSDDDRDDDGLNDEESTEFAGVPSTSTDNEQPGPSGIGKNVVDAPSSESENSDSRCNAPVEVKNEYATEAVFVNEVGDDSRYDNEFNDGFLFKKGNSEFWYCKTCRNKKFYNEEAHAKFVLAKEVKKFYCHYHSTCTELFTKHEIIKHCQDQGIEIENHQKFFERAKSKTLRPKFPEEPCEICSEMFPNKNALEIHYENDHEDQYTCEICKAGFKKIIDYICHLQRHREDNLFACPLCEVTTEKFYQIRVHIKKHEQFRKFKCKICEKRFSCYSSHLEHMKFVHHGQKPCVCDICGKRFRNEGCLTTHKDEHMWKINGGMECEQCKTIFPTYRSLRRHLASHSPKEMFVCDVCGMNFLHKGSLVRHMKSHNGDKQFKCSYCEKRFITSTTRAEHERIHTGDKPFKCPFCNKGFTQRSGMVIHSRTHTGERPYICHLCNRGYTCKATLRSHLNSCKGCDVTD